MAKHSSWENSDDVFRCVFVILYLATWPLPSAGCHGKQNSATLRGSIVARATIKKRAGSIFEEQGGTSPTHCHIGQQTLSPTMDAAAHLAGQDLQQIIRSRFQGCCGFGAGWSRIHKCDRLGLLPSFRVPPDQTRPDELWVLDAMVPANLQ